MKKSRKLKKNRMKRPKWINFRRNMFHTNLKSSATHSQVVSFPKHIQSFCRLSHKHVFHFKIRINSFGDGERVFQSIASSNTISIFYEILIFNPKRKAFHVLHFFMYFNFFPIFLSTKSDVLWIYDEIKI